MSMPQHRPILHHHLVLPLLLVACSIGVRQGPPFDEVFPDASVLVTTTDPASVRARLDESQLPDSKAHHERLFALLRSRQQLHAAHVVLLTNAVGRPETITCFIDGKRLFRYGPRGTGESAKVIDQLLTEGIDRITEIDRRSFGDLIAITQSDTTLRLYTDRFLARVDDGSTAALEQMLDGMTGSPALASFLGVLAPQGGLDGERGWAAFAHSAFDSDRIMVLKVLLTRDAPIDGERMVSTMRAFSFDSSRQEAFGLLAPKVHPLEVEHARASIATFSFDSGREAAFAALGKQGDVQLTDELLVAFVKMCSFDSGKLQCVQALANSLHGEPDGDAARSLLAAFSFDSGRQGAVAVMAKRWLELPLADRQRLLATFSFDSERQQATWLLMR
ncbi:MAG TPA: DUF4476 domain-containing protein [Planctomycetota bacterium]|nr:DUF4476 domain-containing protein [Planctomycetota bacterium]